MIRFSRTPEYLRRVKVLASWINPDRVGIAVQFTIHTAYKTSVTVEFSGGETEWEPLEYPAMLGSLVGLFNSRVRRQAKSESYPFADVWCSGPGNEYPTPLATSAGSCTWELQMGYWRLPPVGWTYVPAKEGELCLPCEIVPGAEGWTQEEPFCVDLFAQAPRGEWTDDGWEPSTFPAGVTVDIAASRGLLYPSAIVWRKYLQEPCSDINLQITGGEYVNEDRSAHVQGGNWKTEGELPSN